MLKHYHTTIVDTFLDLGYTFDTYPFSQLVQDYQEAVLPAVGVAVTALPGLIGSAGDTTDTTAMEDCPGGQGEALLAEKVNDIMVELIEDNKM